MRPRVAPTRAVDGRGTADRSKDAARRVAGVSRLACAALGPTVALVVVWHTIAFVVQHHPALPIADGWARWSSLRQVLDGRMTPAEALVDRHNEHRILLTRLLFLLDLLDGGRDRISTATSLASQAVQAGIWLVLSRHIPVGRPTHCLIGGAIVAMLFTLRQGDNFISGFQAQFTGVFALDVAVALLLLPTSIDGPARRSPSPRRLMLGTAGLLAMPFAMANGLLAGIACAATGFAMRTRAGRLTALLALVVTALSVVLDRLLPSGGARVMAVAVTPTAALHAAAYIGGTVTSGRMPWAIAAGAAGLASSLLILLVMLRRGLRSRTEAVAFQAMLFALMSAGATAAGRVGAGFGIEQALSGRYATGSAAFWAATLVFWTARLSVLPVGRRRRLGVTALTFGAAMLLVFVVRDQHSYDRILAEQDAAAGRVLSALEVGAAPSASDLARIGTDLPTARADVALIRTVRAIDGIGPPPLPQDGDSEGGRGPSGGGPSSEGAPSTGSSTVLPTPPPSP